MPSHHSSANILRTLTQNFLFSQNSVTTKIMCCGLTRDGKFNASIGSVLFMDILFFVLIALGLL